MIDDDAGYPAAPASWGVPLRPVPPRPDELSTAAPVFVTVDFDVGKSPHHWPYWPEPWRRGFEAHPDEGLTLGISGVVALGAATLVLAIESGLKVGFGWTTDIMRMYSGTEQRSSPFGQPRRRFEGGAFLLDAGSRDARGTLMRLASTAATYSLALPHEELLITADSTALVITVATTTLSDWLLPGQRALVTGTDGTTAGVVVQSITATTIVVRRVDAAGLITSATLGNTGRVGGRIMPLISVLLDPVQGFTRYPVTVDLWTVRATAVQFGWCGVDAMGVGASIVTFTTGAAVAVSLLTDDDLLIWDRQNAIDGTGSESMRSGAENVDLGALAFGIAAELVPSWMRVVRYRSTSRADWQWFTAFIRQVRGRQRAWLLSTNRPDLVFDSNTASVFKIKSSTVVGGGDYVSWFASRSHRRIAVTLDNGSIQYREVQAILDNLDGTITLTLDNTVSGTVAMISLLEQVRFDRTDGGGDLIEASWDGSVFSIDEQVRTVEEVIDTQSLRIFDKVLDLSFTYASPPFPPANQEFIVTLGKTTLINFTSDRSLTFTGIAAAGGNVDGMVVCISNVNTAAFSCNLTHEDSASTTANHRLWNPGLATISGSGRPTWYRYNATVSRWINIA